MALRVETQVMVGLACIHAALWVGPYCSYADLHEYATIIEQLWRHGTFALPDGLQSRFCWGFPVMMQPFQALGAGLEAALGRNDVSRWVLCLVPFAAMLCGIRMALARRPDGRPATWDADRLLALALLGLSAPILQFSRRLHLEPVVGCLLLAGIASINGGRLAACGGGLAFGAAVSCHYAYLPGASILAGGMALLRWRRGDLAGALATLGCYAATVALTPISNLGRYGSLFQDGYSRQEEVGWHLHNLVPNLPALGLVLAAVPWLVLAWSTRPASLLTLPMILRCAIAIQVVIWLGTWQFREYPLRYLCAWIMVSAVFLPDAIAWMRRRGRSAIDWMTTVCLVASVITLAGWRGLRPLEFDRELPIHPGRIVTDVWYVPKDGYTKSGPYDWVVNGLPETTVSAPPPWWAWMLGSVLVGGGGLLIRLGIRRGPPPPDAG